MRYFVSIFLAAGTLLLVSALYGQGRGAAMGPGYNGHGSAIGPGFNGHAPMQHPLTGARFGRGHFGHRSNFLWPVPYFDGYDDPLDNYAEPQQQPQVIVIREGATAAPAEQKPVAVVNPHIIEVPVSSQPSKTGEAPAPAAVFVFADGRKVESAKYTLTADTLWIRNGRKLEKIPISELDVDQTIALNRERGSNLKVPGIGEVTTSF